MARAVQRTAARRDFINHYAYLLENAGFDVARRFRKAVEAAYGELAKMPALGVPGKVRRGRHAGVRIWQVPGFTNYLIAYRPHNTGVAIERLVHAGQDYLRVLK
jgi:plasmid stabilization system protein ParE